MPKPIEKLATELEGAGAVMARVSLELAMHGHAKTVELNRVRTRLNTLIRSLRSHDAKITAATTNTTRS